MKLYHHRQKSIRRARILRRVNRRNLKTHSFFVVKPRSVGITSMMKIEPRCVVCQLSYSKITETKRYLRCDPVIQ